MVVRDGQFFPVYLILACTDQNCPDDFYDIAFKRAFQIYSELKVPRIVYSPANEFIYLFVLSYLY